MVGAGCCHCGAVRFSVRSRHPVPYQRCYCTICRKTQGGGGYAINLGADARTLQVQGRDHVRLYHARIRNPEDERAHTSGTPLPVPPEHTHLMLEFKASWVEPAIQPQDKRFDRYPEEAIADWHARTGTEVPE